MEYIESKSTDPRWNLALEQYLFDETAHERSFLMLWQNDNTIVAGKNQNIAAEVNEQFVRSHGITVVRRLSGGGTVYHDLGNLNFTFIVPSGALEKINFRVFCLPIIETLASFGVTAELSGRNDLTVDGKKFSGNAQYLRDGRVMHHGTLMFSSDLTVLGRALSVEREKLHSKGVKSVVSRVANLHDYLPANVTIADFKECLLQHIAKSEPLSPYTLTDSDLAAIAAIKRERYDKWEWNYALSPAYETLCRERIEGVGLVEASVSVKDGRFAALAFTGDFFGSGEASDLASLLLGCERTREDVLARLSGIDVGHYIHNLSPAQLAAILVP
ncbi:MAG: lipoate--protein ligase [Oscillospiraceae bacterium]|nr:lipoate--protein ligase [Oscillospiraceae bacterium]